jgi:hypothetical protein
MYLQTSRLQYDLQGVVLLQTAFSKNKFDFRRAFIISKNRKTVNPCSAVNKERGILQATFDYVVVKM